MKKKNIFSVSDVQCITDIWGGGGGMPPPSPTPLVAQWWWKCGLNQAADSNDSQLEVFRDTVHSRKSTPVMVETFIPKYYVLSPDIGTLRVYYEIFVEEKLTRQSASLLRQAVQK
jgi:hypothetical protein